MMEIRLLRADDDRSRFSCGDVELDRFFQAFAGQNQYRLHIGTTYVAVDQGQILGYVTVAATSIAVASLPKRLQRQLPRYPLPALRLARLAVSASAQSRGIGKRMLRFVLELALDMADRFGCIGIVVDAKANAVEFYRRFGFSEFAIEMGELHARPSPIPMFLPIGAIPPRASQ